MTDQPGASAVRRNAPAGDFLIEHFMAPGDRRTHAERINPLVNGESFGWCPGADRGFQPQPLQTYNTTDTVILAQIPAPSPVIEAVEDEGLMSEAAVEQIAETLSHGNDEAKSG